MKLYIKRGDDFELANAEHVVKEASALLFKGLKRGVAMDTPRASGEFLRHELGALEHEVFSILMLDNRHKLIKYQQLFRGTVDGASVHPREVVKEVLACNACAVILAHNHPSGDPEPSQADELTTNRLKNALALIDVRVLDHIVVARERQISFAERGLL